MQNLFAYMEETTFLVAIFLLFSFASLRGKISVCQASSNNLSILFQSSSFFTNVIQHIFLNWQRASVISISIFYIYIISLHKVNQRQPFLFISQD